MSMQRSPNVVPKGAIRLSEAFDLLCSKVDPDWSELPQLCIMWNENVDVTPSADELGQDPHDREFEISSRAETIFRTALTAGRLRTYILNIHTGVDLELKPTEWRRFGETVGLPCDYTSESMPGPDCILESVANPIFLVRNEFERWLNRDELALELIASQRGAPEPKAFSLEEVSARTGLSRSKLYQEIEQKRLFAKKCGNRTLVLESDLTAFLTNLPDFRTGTSPAVKMR